MTQQIKITQTSNADMNISVSKTLTAVEWLVEEYHLPKDSPLVIQAKAMEKEQIIEAFFDGAIYEGDKKHVPGRAAYDYYDRYFNQNK